MGHMLAAIVNGLGNVRCQQVKKPEPQLGSVLIETQLASICGSDLHIVYQGWNVNNLPLPPGYPGHEGVGKVVDGGQTQFTPGQLVLTVPQIAEAKTFAEFQLLKPDNLIVLPADKPASHYLMAQQLGTVIFGVKRIPDVSNKTVVIIGQGTVGLFHNVILRKRGAKRIIVIDPIQARLNMAIKLNVDETIIETSSQATDTVKQLTHGHGADIVIDAVGSIETLNQSIDIASESGLISAFGLPSSMKPVLFNWADFFRKSLTMYSIHGAQEENGLPDFKIAIDMISSNQIDMSWFVNHSFPIHQINEAFNQANSKSDCSLKTLITF